MRRILLAIFCALALAGCAVKPEIPRSEEAVRQAVYRHGGQPALTLITVRNNRTGQGAHTALLISGSEQVIFDPAGSFHHEEIERRGDVLVGIDPAFWQGYKSMHARATHHVVTQRIPVSAETANRALQLAYDRGEVAAAHCAHSTANLLRQLPGFASIRVGYYPNDLAEQFETITGAQQVPYYEDFTPRRAAPAAS